MLVTVKKACSNLFLMLLLCLQFFPLIHDELPPVVSVDVLNSSKSKWVTYVDFSKATSSSTLTSLNGCFSLFNAVRMQRMMCIGDCLNVVGNTHTVILFAHTTVSIEVNQRMEVTL